jgi:hypothetical protein
VTLRLTPNRIWQLSSGLSERDLAVVATLSKVRVASIRQLERAHFPNQPRTARRVLAALVERRLVARLGRTIGGVRAGSAGHVYALDIVGQSLSQNGGPAHGSRLRRPWTPGVRFLDHALAVSEVYVQLVEGEREGAFELVEFQGEPESWRQFSPHGAPLIVKPDAFVRLGYPMHEDSYFMEVDRGTESVRTLTLKAEIYERYWNSGHEQHDRGVFPKVLWLVPDLARSRVLEGALTPSKDQEAAGLQAVAIFGALRDAIAASS